MSVLIYRGRILCLYREGDQYRVTIPTKDASCHMTIEEMADMINAVALDRYQQDQRGNQS